MTCIALEFISVQCYYMQCTCIYLKNLSMNIYWRTKIVKDFHETDHLTLDVVKEFLSRSQIWSFKKCERFSWNWSSHIVKEFITTMGDKSVKIWFLSVLISFPPFPPKQCWFLHFFDCTDHSTYTILNWGAVGIRELTLDATKIEQMLKYRKASFPKSVSTSFVAHCRYK